MSIIKLSNKERFVLFGIAGGCFLLHLIVNLTGAYGFFRDELYYIACSDNLAWGYVDQPPFSLFLLKLSRMIAGDSLTAIRMTPTLLHAGTVIITGLMVKEMGGRIVAILLACLAVAFSIIHLGMNLIYSMNAIDIFLWALAMYLILKIINTSKESHWIALGVVLGIGLLNKISVLFLGAGIGLGFLFTDRVWFSKRTPYIAAGIALVLFLPYILWNVANDMAHLEFIRNASGQKYASLNATKFIVDQFVLLNPVSAPFWMAGLLAAFWYSPLSKYRIIGWIYVTAFVILILNGTSKGEYLVPAYAGLFAMAGIFVEQRLTSKYVAWIRYAYPIALTIATVGLIPLVLPVLPVEKFITYSKELGIAPSSNEAKELAELPQFYADMFGWEEKARDVATVYNALTEEEKKKCAIFSMNYGRCGAIDFFGDKYGLPNAIGNHNNYWIWGPRGYTGELVIVVGGRMEDHADHFESVELAVTSTCTYCMPYENNVAIFLCRKLKFPLQDIWEGEKHFE